MTLLEVSVSLLLLSFILLGFDAAELYSFRKAQEGYFLNVAVNQLQEMTERLTALQNSNGLEQQMVLWNAHNQEVLPQAKGTLTASSQLKITWGNHACLIEEFHAKA